MKNFLKRYNDKYKELKTSPEHKAIRDENSYRGKMWFIYLMSFGVIALLMGYFIENIFHITSQLPSWILLVLSMIASYSLASYQARKKYKKGK